MTDTASVYQSLISAKSRRLRVTGALLLVAVLCMTFYGYFALMPSLRALPRFHAQHRAAAIGQGSAANGAGVRSPAATPGEAVDPVTGLTENERKAALAKVLFVYAYWSVCGVLLLALIIVSWLDFRELSRNYDAHRRSLFLSEEKTEASKQN